MTEPVHANAIEVVDLRVVVESSGYDVVDEVTFAVQPGETLGLVGESGCGKSTVALMLLGFVRPGLKIASGSVVLNGKELVGASAAVLRGVRGSDVAYIPQDPMASLNPAMRIGTQLGEVLARHASTLSADERDERVREVLSETSLPTGPPFLRRFAHELSGGQQQRVVIAMAFLARPKLIVCDEPTTGLDVTTQQRVLQMIHNLSQRHHTAVVYISHDLAVVSELATRVAVMYAGRIVESGTTEEVFGRPSHPYSRALLLSTPDVDGEHLPIGIPGFAPGPGERPNGCHFSDRCDFATDECRVSYPPAVRARGHAVRCIHTEDLGRAPLPARPKGVEPQRGGDAVLLVEKLNAHYGKFAVLRDVSVSVLRKECVGIVGESGSGKTTLAKCIAGLHYDHTGSMTLDGDPLAQRARSRSAVQRKGIQYIFQNPYASLNPRMTVGASIGTPLKLYGDMNRRARAAEVSELLHRVALSPSLASRRPEELSGGQRQRVAIARALATQPSILVCDEVTSALDVSVQAAILDLLNELQRDTEVGLLFITHDLAVVRQIASRLIVMKDGYVVEAGPTNQIVSSPQNDYSRVLLGNTPSLDIKLRGPTSADLRARAIDV